MPAPLGKTPTRKMPDIQVFGRERLGRHAGGAPVLPRAPGRRSRYSDLRKRPIAPGELRRFVERLGARALLDETSRAYRDGGLGYLRLDEAGIVARLLADPRLLRLPLVAERQRGDGRSRRGDLGRVAQVRGRALSAVTRRRPARSTTQRGPGDAQRTSSIMKPEPRMMPEPWPIQTIPTRTRTAAMIQRDRIDASQVAS